MSILAILEQRGGAWNKMSFETLAAAQQLGSELGAPVHAAVIGSGVSALSADLSSKAVAGVCQVEHTLLKNYTPDAFVTALAQLIDKLKPTVVLFPHTYQVRDFAPALATRLNRVLVSDVTGHRVDKGQLVLIRQLFQGKVNADTVFATEAPNFASLQAGSYRGDQVAEGTVPAPIETFTPQLDAGQIRTRPLELFRESARAVDLTAAEIIVSVGRGIKEPENIPIIEKLAKVLGAEMAGSRPVCDNGWMPMERQVGSSGQTVAPKMYLAVGISGAIQHLVGMKGSKYVVAINKDPEAPIFEIADYGIVGDLFDIAPALAAEVRRVKGA